MSTKEALIKKLAQNIESLSEARILEVNDFAEFLAKKSGDDISSHDLARLAMEGQAFNFLNDEPDLYTINDCKVNYK
ncbi:MAG: DUF2281 domain-containing protein [Flavobacteriales bacterium]|nr:DUF2281 domain-containing protein [Flavobacteriales bacterium]